MDIVVFGVTGFVGRLVARYLAEHAPVGVTIGLAGRSPEKLEQLAAELGVAWPLVVTDTSDKASLAAMASDARVVATTVGPVRRSRSCSTTARGSATARSPRTATR